MAADNTPDPEFIPIIEEVLSNSQALMFLVGGAIVGAFVLWAFYEYQKSEKARQVGTAFADKAHDIPVLGEVIQQQRGQNDFDAYEQG